MATPTDPLYATQWHFALIGDIETIWDDYDGSGVNVGVYDDGIEYTHEDIAANYDASLHVVDADGQVIDPMPVLAGDGHGTSCAGLIAADANGVGGVGVASGATLTGVNIFGSNVFGYVNGDPEEFYVVVRQATSFDISSNSWGATPMFFQGLTDGGFADLLEDEYALLSANGRGGLGTIITQAAGNDDMDGNGDGVNASRYTITVAATDEFGDAAYYSNYGACILVAAPAGAVTTDRSGTAGYDPTQFTTEFGGTSAATPITSGVIALMLEANGGLGWRDVQNILAASATLTGADFDATRPGAEEDGLWQVNSAGNWNGGGMHVHTNYGYGMLNVLNAVRMAEVWHLFDSAQDSGNEVHVTSGLNNFADVALGPLGGVGYTTTFTITDAVMTEHVALTLDLIGRPSHLVITLTSAAGTVINVMDSAPAFASVNGTWTFAIDHLRGELSEGTWTLNVVDTRTSGTETLRSASLDIYGAAATTDTVHHVTDEYLVMLGHDASRATLTDSDGGQDWLNMAAVTGHVALTMADGGGFSIGGRAAGTLDGVFEHVVTGDGNDTLTGNGQNNAMHGARGNDRLDGKGGTDTLVGGTGNDVYVWDGQDQVQEAAGQGIDTLESAVSAVLMANVENLTLTGAAVSGTGTGAANVIRGNGQDNTLNGGTGADTLVGGLGHDLFITDGGDTITEQSGEGTDTVHASVSMTLGAHLENLTLIGKAANGTGNVLNNALTGNGQANLLNGGDGHDTVTAGTGNDSLLGGVGNDLLNSGAGADRANGDAGHDTLNGNDGSDLLYGGNGNDSLVGGNGNDGMYGGAGNDALKGGIGADKLYGDDANDVLNGGDGADGLFGGAGNDALNGGNGNDTLQGGGGADTLTGAVGADSFVFNTTLGSGNVDRITDFNAAADTIQLDDAIFGALAAGGLAASAFVSSAAGVAATAAHRIVHNSATGDLFYDADGAGGAAQVRFATLTPGVALTSADFLVV